MKLNTFFTNAQIEQMKSYINPDELSTWLRIHAPALSLGMGIGLVTGIVAMALASSKSAQADSSRSTAESTSKTSTSESHAQEALPLSTSTSADLETQPPVVVWPANLSANVHDLVLLAELLSPQTLSKALLVHYVTQRYPGLMEPAAFVDALLAHPQFAKVAEDEDLWQLTPSSETSASTSSLPTSNPVAGYPLMLNAALATVKQLATAETPMQYYAYAQALHDKLAPISTDESKLTKTQRLQVGQSLHAWARVELQNQQAQVATAHLDTAVKIFKLHYGDKHIKVVPVLADLAKAYGRLNDSRAQLSANRQAIAIVEAYDGRQTPRHQQLLHTVSLGSSRPQARVTGLAEVAAFYQTHYGALPHTIRALVAAQLILAERILASNNASLPQGIDVTTHASRVIEAEQQLEHHYFSDAVVFEEQARTEIIMFGHNASSLLGSPSPSSTPSRSQDSPPLQQSSPEPSSILPSSSSLST